MKKKEKEVSPIIVTEVHAVKEKKAYVGVPTQDYHDNHIRCIVLKDYEGMNGFLKKGDIIDLPIRRFKSLAGKGYVDIYLGKGRATSKR